LSMKNDFQFDYNSLASLYGPSILLMDPVVEQPIAPIANPVVLEGKEKKQSPAEATETKPKTSGITWKPKPGSKILFVLQAEEFKDKELGELLKKIVESLEIPLEFAGFGMISGEISMEEFEAMPTQYAVVFDQQLASVAPNPVVHAGKSIFFSQSLRILSSDTNSKKALWGYLKEVRMQFQ
jgi:DNA polymerase III psi subunit